MDPNIGGIMVVSAILLLISNASEDPPPVPTHKAKLLLKV